MEEFKIKNNAGEEFTLFTNEEDEVCLNVKFKGELLAAMIFSDEEAYNLAAYLEGVIKW